MTDIHNQYPDTTPPPENARADNRTPVIIAAVLGVLLLIAAIIIGWLWATRDSDEATSAAETTTTSTTPATSSVTSPVETVTETSAVPEPEASTVTNTVSVEETTQTITQQSTVISPPTPGNQGGSATPVCDPAAFREDGHGFVDGLLFCESGWARGGQDQTDYVRVFQWVDDSWSMYAPAGESTITGYPCYDTAAMATQGAPAALLDQTLDCSAG